MKRRNTIFERAKFNMRIQGENEPVDAFITDLYALAEHCGYADLHDEMIRDRIVVGLQDARLSEKLQLDGALTLDKAVNTVRQAEAPLHTVWKCPFFEHFRQVASLAGQTCRLW